jgi:beta-lactamase class A
MLSVLLFALFAADLDQIARAAQGHVGALAIDLGIPGAAPLELRAAERFPMQSVYKLPIAMAVLHQVDAGHLQLEQRVMVAKAVLVPASLHSPVRDEHPGGGFQISLRDLVRYAVSESDGTASDVLMRLAGGPAAVQKYLESLGVTEVTIANTEMEMAHDDRAQYRNWATPRGMIALLRAFQEGRGLSAASRTLLLDFMTNTATGPNRLRGQLPPGTVVAHKTGTSGTSAGFTAATNDVGLVTMPNGTTFAIAVCVSDSPADTAVREAVIANICRAAWDRFSRN